MSRMLTSLSLIALLSGGAAAATERMLIREITVSATLDAVWHAWTTEEGLRFISSRSSFASQTWATAP